MGAERHVFVVYAPRILLIYKSSRPKVENERPRETDSPGPPFGPRYLSTATVFSPFLISPFSTASTKASSVSNVLAFPVNSSPSFPVILATAPPGAKLPFKILRTNEISSSQTTKGIKCRRRNDRVWNRWTYLRCPVDLIGFSSGLITS